MSESGDEGSGGTQGGMISRECYPNTVDGIFNLNFISLTDMGIE